MLPASTSGSITLMEIQAQTEEISRDADEKDATYQVYLLRQPEEPTIEIDEDYLVITLLTEHTGSQRYSFGI